MAFPEESEALRPAARVPDCDLVEPSASGGRNVVRSLGNWMANRSRALQRGVIAGRRKGQTPAINDSAAAGPTTRSRRDDVSGWIRSVFGGLVRGQLGHLGSSCVDQFRVGVRDPPGPSHLRPLQ
jgi:hypothetical protein